MKPRYLKAISEPAPYVKLGLSSGSDEVNAATSRPCLLVMQVWLTFRGLRLRAVWDLTLAVR